MDSDARHGRSRDLPGTLCRLNERSRASAKRPLIGRGDRIRSERYPRKAVADLDEIAERENLSMAGLVRRVFDDVLMATITKGLLMNSRL